MFFQKARTEGQNGWMQFLATAIFIILCYGLTSAPFTLYALVRGFESADITRYQGPLAFGLMLFVFSGLLFGVFLGTKFIHRRSVLSVLTGASRFRWKHLLKGAAIWLVLLIILEIVGYIAEPASYSFHWDPIPFFLCLLVGILILPFQTTAEEVLIRGYLMQQLGLVSSHRWIPVLVTSVFFGLLHSSNPEVTQYGMIKAMSLYIGMGLFFGIATAMDDGLEIPIGMHYINNLFAFLFVGYRGSVIEGTPTLFMKESEDLTFASVLMNLLIMGLVLLVFRKIFKWPDFKYLLEKIRFSYTST